jgi:hypothetical protein
VEVVEVGSIEVGMAEFVEDGEEVGPRADWGQRLGVVRAPGGAGGAEPQGGEGDPQGDLLAMEFSGERACRAAWCSRPRKLAW